MDAVYLCDDRPGNVYVIMVDVPITAENAVQIRESVATALSGPEPRILILDSHFSVSILRPWEGRGTFDLEHCAA